MCEKLSQRETAYFLMHLGDAAISIENRETIEKVNDIQKACGVHETCENYSTVVRQLLKGWYDG